ncbi:ElyC/SanA/YdcF family protein [Lactiplantibacillus daowaiensis]|uniref:ElyC/SanA/YdcF family protein n=1 Tax=Lactiplantibacillus daowaiensis TaxID=2559918 RepID=A0ABW1S1N7_9LACO|nr:ElyC/SanA/YdcF family protein [Lactiplantibacillus daowaiensis]
MTNLAALNQCLAWLTAPATPLTKIDGLVLCGNSLPLTAQLAARLAITHQLPTVIIAGGIGHATKYLRQNLHVQNDLSEAEQMAQLMRAAGYQGEIRQDKTSTNTGANAKNALALAPEQWQNVLLVQDPLLARRTQLTFEQVWGDRTHFSRVLPLHFQLTQLDPLVFGPHTIYQAAWEPAYFTELLLGELQRLWDTPQGYGPAGAGYIRHIEIPVTVLTAYQTLLQQALNRER